MEHISQGPQGGQGEVVNVIREGSNSGANSLRNDSSSNQMLNMVNLATMSDSQFRDSLDALLGDNFSGQSASSPRLSGLVASSSEPNQSIAGACACATTGSTTGESSPALPDFPCTTNFGADPGPMQPTTADFIQSNIAPIMSVSQPTAMIPPPPALSQLQFMSDPNTGLPGMISPNMFPPNFMISQPFGIPVQTTSYTGTPQQPIVAPLPSISMPINNQVSLLSQGSELPSSVGSLTSLSQSTKKRARCKTVPQEVPSDVNDFRKRRADRNAREQQRAQQVTDQIAHLRELLGQSGISLSKTDKFSTLIMVEKYIRSLQVKSAQLVADHQQLLLAMQQTNEHISKVAATNEHVTTKNVCSSSGSGSGSDDASKTSSSQDSEEEGLPAVKEINYKWIFNSCPFPVAIASIDGRFMEINKEFEDFTCYSRNELLPLERDRKKRFHERSSGDASKPDKDIAGTSSTRSGDKKCNMSIFNILHRDCIERMFCPMSKILQLNNSDEEDEDQGDDSSNGDDSGDKDTIAQEVHLCKRSGQKAKMKVTLVRSSKGLPRFFYCVLIPLQEGGNVVVSQVG